ncbi:calcium/calmodulin-dependent protein kinase type 1 [Culex quinquefasciatus]|uniref:Calcium/calmodulin-dependent protein kinase type 1 n=1 Tax=Culex quinquefasciatus TaxID=7176 RepID=B0XJJ7_CULQU|nr:calcium/calmodulin-dependent protein kinase type 1 [Culex quinquefasciatus]|eukprot:XP_001869819.1 calcium/calmodulin-dependent protein kinase type 1 [Culex quinquefasciatus]
MQIYRAQPVLETCEKYEERWCQAMKIDVCGFQPVVSPDNQQEQLFDAILNGFFDFPAPYWNNIGDSVRNLIINMLQSDPELRFSSEDILDHPWLTSDVVDDTRDPNGYRTISNRVY